MKYDITQDEELFKKIKSNYTKFDKSLHNPDKLSKNLKPINIIVMPRSGTTLCEQILSSHSKITGAGELNYLDEISGLSSAISPNDQQLSDIENTLNDKKSLMNVRRLYLEKLAQHDKQNSNYVCDKMPHNFLFIGLILSLIHI